MLRGMIMFTVMSFLVGIPLWFSGQPVYICWELGAQKVPGGMSLSVLLDPLGLGFGVVVGFVACQVYWYSVGYMSTVSGRCFYFGPLNMFVVSMVLLVVSSDLLVIFLAWDCLGISSFLLVFFYDSSQSAGASLITSLTNRFGDGCFLFGMLSELGDFCLHSGCMLGEGSASFLFILAAFSKSAQWPLCAWLPAAMAAPTPISSLVHSSTLVTAGVFLLLRVEGASGTVFDGWSWVPGFTLILSSISACLSHDLKRIVAMSTLGHLSLMMVAVTSGFLSVAYFHLLTHALYKSLLFMSAGNAISYYGDSQDIRDMGGMLYSLPLSSMGLMVSLMSLSGVPFTSGFYSKDLVLEVISFCGSSSNGGMLGLGLLSLPLSSYYCSRVWWFLVSSRPGAVVGVSVEWNPAVVGPLLSLFVVSVVVGPFLEGLMYPWGHCFCVDNGWVYSVSLVSVGVSLLSSWELFCFYGWCSYAEVKEDYGVCDFHGLNNLFYIRAPYHLSSGWVLQGSLQYIKHVEHGWLEYAGPQGLAGCCKFFAAKSVMFEW